MKTLNSLLIALTAAVSLNANADPLYGDPAIDDIFPMEDVAIKHQTIKTDIADTGRLVWSVPYEQWVNPADFNSSAKRTIASALQELENNPPASGSYSRELFKWDETAGEYQLQ